jgi:hypothetical protein
MEGMFAERLLRAYGGPSAAVVYFLKAAIAPAMSPDSYGGKQSLQIR